MSPLNRLQHYLRPEANDGAVDQELGFCRRLAKPLLKAAFAAAVAAPLTLGGCVTQQDAGRGLSVAVGGLGGGFLGSQFGKGKGQLAMTAVGTLLGAFAGNALYDALPASDKIMAQKAEQRALDAPVGQPVTWSNPETRNSGTIRVTNDGLDRSGAYCREYQQEVVINGKTERMYGTACRQPDGSWKTAADDRFSPADGPKLALDEYRRRHEAPTPTA